MDREKVNYATIICARNEEQYIEDCVKAILNQTLPPYTFLIIDDGSTDSTRDIIAKYVYGNPHVEILALNNPRSKVRGVNTVQALNAGIAHIGWKYNTKYLLTVDADTVIPPTYAETLINYMEKNPKLGVTSGFPVDAKFSYEHVPNGGRLYRWDFIQKIRQIPPITGFDSWLKFKIRQIGYQVRGYNIRYIDRRPNIAKIHRHYLWGRSSYIIGQPFLIVFAKAFRYLKHKPPILSSLIYLLSYMIHKLTGWKLFTREYYRYLDDYFKRLIRRGVRRRIEVLKWI